MRPLAAHEINGVWATPLIDVGPDGHFDVTAVARQIDILHKAGVDGVYTHGTAAEFHGQGDHEFRAFCETVAERAHALNLPFQIGATHPFARETLDRIAFARSLAPSAIQIILPDWAPVSDRTIDRFLDGCVDAADGVGLVLYNPPHAKRTLTAQDYVARLAGRHGIVGLKCAGGDDEWYRIMAPVLDSISVFIPGHFMASGMQKGARGSYSNVCCLNPEATVAWRDMIATDPTKALAVEARLTAFMTRAMGPYLENGYPGYACDKMLAHIGGWTTMSPRLIWPYDGLPTSDIDQIRALAQDIIPDFVPTEAPPPRG